MNMKATSIINKEIEKEKRAIKNHAAVLVFGVLMGIATFIFVPTLSEFTDDEQKTLAATSDIAPVLVGLIPIWYPLKEILDRKDNIRDLQNMQFTCDVVFKQDEEKCLELILKKLWN